MAAGGKLDLLTKGVFHGELVEIRGLKTAVEARDCRLELLGAAVEANGRCGYAHWSAVHERYSVQTLDGLFLEVDEANLITVDKLEPEDGGYDLQWPGIAGGSEAFAFMVAESLQAKGFCLVQMFETEVMRRSLQQHAAQREDFTLPATEFEEAYLGRSASSKVAWLDGADMGEWNQDPIAHYEQFILALVRVILPIIGDYLGFKPHDYLSGTMLRLPLRDEVEYEELSPGPVTQDAIQAGIVERHLDFLQRRRLCVMYLIDNDGGTLELHLRQDVGERVVRIPITKDKLLIFRCDLLSYSYKPRGSNRDVVIQTWVVEEPAKLKIDSFVGDVKGMEAIIGGSAMPTDKQVHLMAAHCRFPGVGYGLEKAHLAWTAQVDCFKQISTGRFDMDLYFVGESEQFAIAGKSVTKHIGCLEDHEWINFDNDFFGMEPEYAFVIPPCQRISLELSVETLNMVGYRSLESLRGNRQMSVIVADIGLDWESWCGYQQGEVWLKAGICGNAITTSTRLHYLLGLEGPSVQVDTACSASMVGSVMGHSQLRRWESGISEAFVCGLQNILTPWPFIGLSGAGMVGRAGRSLFFDQSANGFARGEGWGGLYMKTSQTADAVQERLCCVASTYANQDGRSASLTAPNGPSQQAVIRGSLTNMHIHPDEVVCTENHGTGTALGDPIEGGTVKAVFGRKRQTGPIPVTSGKSHMGHLEPAAGTVGILKTLVSLIHAAVPANVHLRHLNAHVDHTGFPCSFPVERCPIESEYHYGGANGFGFGGTNARVDLWARRLHRVGEALPVRGLIGAVPIHGNMVDRILPKKMEKLHGINVKCARCQGSMCWLCGAKPSKGTQRHQCSTVREEFAPYDLCCNCYDGGYILGDAVSVDEVNAEVPSLPHNQKFFLTGTWNAWSTFDPMTETLGPADADVYETEVTLGETRREQFYVVMERHGSTAYFYPVTAKANPGVCILGPEDDEPGADKCWQIDGRRDGVMAGTVYVVRFAWGDTQKWITWEATNRRRSQEDVWEEGSWHNYSVIGSLSEWRPMEMRQNKDHPGLWEVCGRIPPRGEAEFVLQRDEDPRQTLYPLRTRPRDTSTPLVGPDESGGERRWQLSGSPGELVIFRLRVSDTGDFSLQVISDSMGDLTWRSPAGSGGTVYDLACSCFNRQFSKASELIPDKGNPHIRRCHFKMSGVCKEDFQIVVNQNWTQCLYPEVNRDPPGSGLSCGPDDQAEGRKWEVVGYPGQTFEVVLNLKAEDSRKLVSCFPLESAGWGELDDGRTEWTDEEWTEWEARWSAYGEQVASNLYETAVWPSPGDWPGASKQRQSPPRPSPAPQTTWLEPAGAPLRPWEEAEILE